MQTVIKHEISALDFLRGWAAIFVFFHHAAILGGGPKILAGHLGQEAVNGFMLASGFLIFYQCSISNTYQQLKNYKGIKAFYIRRFFRISPLYYVMLFVALGLSYYLGASREIIAETLHSSSTEMSRYYIENYIESILLHITYIFGLLPQYSFSTPLPDWSLGLEMQFYVLFPLFYWLYKKNFLTGLSLLLIAAYGIQMLLISLDINYRMPSFLPLKFQNFSAGIALAYLYVNKDKLSAFNISAVVLITSAALVVMNKNLYMLLVFLGLWAYLCPDLKQISKIKKYPEIIFSHKSSKFLADISYSVYLTHLILMLPFFAYVLENGKLSRPEWAIWSLLLLGIVCGLSFLTYKFIELPGIKLGKFFIKKD